MIDPANITKFDRTQAELEEFLLFCIVAAGKNSKVQAKKLDEFLFNVDELSPFEWVRELVKTKSLRAALERVKLGQYNRLETAFYQVAHCIFPKDCSLSALESVDGIGSKTARFFILHSRPDQQLAVLDTHILRYMREVHGIKTPKATPPKKSKRYADLQTQFLALVPTGTSVADFDLSIWNYYNAKTFNNDSDKSKNAAAV